MAKIFIIDDDFASELIVENLRQRGHDAERLSTVDSAVRDADRIAAGDLVVLDVIMPRSAAGSAESVDGARSTGMAVFRELRRRRADLPTRVFTANQDPALVEVVNADRCARYISRWSGPKLKELVDIIHEILGIVPVDPPRRPFIVHGHDNKTKLEVKNYLQNILRLPEPIILHEQPSIGRTLIEKFEDLSAAADLVFVLLTPDDHLADPAGGNAEKRRARQNVILEMGFFLGSLGRRSGRILLLFKGPLDLPSDLSGVVYIDIGAGVEAAGEQIRREVEAVRG